MNIRAYTPTDHDTALQLLRLNIPEYFAATEEADLVDYLANHIEEYYVVEDAGTLLGCGGINFSKDGQTGMLSWDFFHPGHQGKGLGTKLTQYRIARLKANEKIRRISVRTSQLAYKFYEKQGFELKEIINDYWAEGYDMYRMEYPYIKA